MIGSSLRYVSDKRWKKLYYALFGVPYISAHIKARAISSSLPKSGSHRVLDAGCGNGMFSFWIAQQMPKSEIIGIDSSKREIRFAKKMSNAGGQKNLLFELGDLRYLQGYEKFDLVLCLDVLEHIVEDGQVLNSLYKELKNDGLLLIHVPRRHQEQFRFFGSWVNWEHHDHVRDEYTEDEILAKLIGAGFKIANFKTTFTPAQAPFWEVATKLRKGAPILNWYIFPLLLLGSILVSRIKSDKGNGFLLVCEKS